jgi:hypothetical protein
MYTEYSTLKLHRFYVRLDTRGALQTLEKHVKSLLETL